MSTTTSASIKKEISSYILPILIVLAGLFISMGNLYAVKADNSFTQPTQTAQSLHMESGQYTVTGKAGYTVTGSAGFVPAETGEPAELLQTPAQP